MAGSIRRRGSSTWEVTVDLGRDPVTGRRRRRFMSIKGKRQDAERALTQALHERDTGIEIVPGKVTVAEFLERWLNDYAKPNVGRSTHERYVGIVRNYATPAFGALPLTKLKPTHLQAAYAAWIDAGLSAKTVMHHHRMLHEAFDHGVGWQLLAANPAGAAKPPRPERTEVQALSLDQLRAVLAAAEVLPDPYPTIVAVAAATGMRQGELLALRWSDCDLDTGVVRVTRTARRFAGAGIVYGDPKTYRSRRPVRLAKDTAEMLRAYRVRQNESRLKAGPEWRAHDLVFTGPVGQPIDARNLLDWFRKMTSAAKVGRLPFHALRHTCATLMVDAGVNARVVADRLGHANATFTLNTYYHTTSDIEAEAAEAISAAIHGGKSARSVGGT